jgi:hypothetical protein
MAVVWGQTILPAEKTVVDPVKLFHDLGSNSVTSYVWIHHAQLPEHPSPRADQSQTFDNSGYPFMNTIKDNTPENFRAALELAKQRLLEETNSLHILNLNCWNEWTEGSYLEPDMVHGFQYLDAIKDVFTGTK